MAEYGLGNFKYEFTAENGQAKFKFYDEQDASNTAETAVSSKDFPEGITQPDSRQVADIAYLQVSKQLNDKRDARLEREANEATASKLKADRQAREAADDHFAHSNDVSVAPAKVEEDGTRVYNTAEPSDTNNKGKK